MSSSSYIWQGQLFLGCPRTFRIINRNEIAKHLQRIVCLVNRFPREKAVPSSPAKAVKLFEVGSGQIIDWHIIVGKDHQRKLIQGML